jgi:hypothetical protein
VNGYLRFRPQFQQALDSRLYNIEYLDALLLSGRAKCWFNDSAAIVAEIRKFPTGAMAVCGVIAAGELEAIVKLIPEAEAWGREHGCQFGMIESTEGWQRVMKKHGYDVFQVSLIKPL